jgi:hypothetical protein
MSISLTLNDLDVTTANNILAMLNSFKTTPSNFEPLKDAPEAKPRTPRAASAIKTKEENQSAPTPVAMAKPEPKVETATDDNAAYEDLKATILKAVSEGHREKVVAVFSEFGVTSAQALQPTDYTKVKAKVAAFTDDLA